MRWLVTGAGGMLGRAVTEALAGAEVRAATRADLDLTDVSELRAAVSQCDVVINAAAWTDVDRAESEEDAASRVNGHAVDALANACAIAGARLLHVSTDYVFAGDAGAPYPEYAPPCPVNAYGRSKLIGEQAVLSRLPQTGYVIRTSWLYGAGGRNFVDAMLRAAETRDIVDVVTDQRGQPTWTQGLAQRLVEMGTIDAPPGIYHATASGETTWFGLAQAVFEEAGLDPDRVHPATSAAFARPAVRPAYSVLGHQRWRVAGLPPLAHWRDQLRSYLRHHSTMTDGVHPGSPPPVSSTRGAGQPA